MARPTVRTISRYLLRQHCAPLGFALAALTSLMLLNQIAKQFGSLVGKGLPWSVILEVFVLSVPFIVAVTLPMAVLVAVLHVFTRLASDNEFTALQASGVSVGRVIIPVLGGAAGVALLSFLWNDQVLPRSNHRLRTLQVDIQRKKPSFTLKEQVINEVVPGQFFLRAARIDPNSNKLKDVTIYDLGDAERRRIIGADSGRMAYTPGGRDLYLTLEDGDIQAVNRTDPTEVDRTFFRINRMRVAGIGNTLERTEHDTYKSDREMSICEMRGMVALARREADRAGVDADVAVQNDLRRLAGLVPVYPAPPPPAASHGAPAVRAAARPAPGSGARGADPAEPHHARGDDRRGAAPPLGRAAGRAVRGGDPEEVRDRRGVHRVRAGGGARGAALLPWRSGARDRLERGGLHRVLRGADRRRESRRPSHRAAVFLDVAAEPALRRGRRARRVAHPQAGKHAMTTLDRYVLREWAKVFFLATFGFPLLVFVIDLADNLEKYTSGGVSKGHLALSYVCYLPETITLVLPVAVLFAVVFTVGALDRHSELTAAKASGLSFHRVVRPLFAAAVVAVLVDVGLTELAPVTSSRRAELLGQKQIRSDQFRNNFVYRADGGWVYAIGGLELARRAMRDVIMEREGTGPEYPTIVIAAPQASYDTARRARGWTLSKGTVHYLLGPGSETAFTFDRLSTRDLREAPVDLLAEPKAPDEMRYAELGRYIDALARSGSDTKKLRVERALKLSVPVACIIIALFGAPLAISTPKSGAAWGVAVCLATTFVDLLMFQLSKAVGAGGVLPPSFAAWVPNFVVGAAAVWLIKNART